MLLLLDDDAPPGADISFNGPMLALPYSLQRLGFTYVRNSLKTVYQGNALVTLAANQFGTTYDAVTGLHAYEAEPAATNLATNSEGAAATWVVSNVTNAGTPISGFAASLAFGDNSVQRSARKNISHAAGTAYSISVFVQMDDGLAPVLGVTTSTGDFYLYGPDGGLCTLNPLVINIANGLYRVSAARVAAGTATTLIGVIKSTAQSARTFRVIGIQVETGSRATSYIATDGSTRTRAADVLSTATANIPGFNAAGYTLVVDFREDISWAAGNRRIMSINDGTTNNRANIVSSGTTYITQVTSGGAAQAFVTSGTVSTARRKMAHSVTLDASLSALDGAARTADTSLTMPVGLTTLNVGHETGVEPLNGFIYGFKLIPVALNQEQTTGQTT